MSLVKNLALAAVVALAAQTGVAHASVVYDASQPRPTPTLEIS